MTPLVGVVGAESAGPGRRAGPSGRPAPSRTGCSAPARPPAQVAQTRRDARL